MAKVPPPLGTLLRERDRMRRERLAFAKGAHQILTDVSEEAARILISTTITAFDEDGRSWVFQRAKATELFARRVLTIKNKTIRITRADAEAGTLDPTLACCDFCTDSTVAWLADAESFTYAQGTLHSHGAWAACDPCGLAIIRRDRKALYQRAVKAFSRDAPPRTIGPLKRELADQHEAFWNHFISIQPRPEAHDEQG